MLRVTALGELTSSLAHEISQPLSAILSNAQAASRFLESGQPADVEEVGGALSDIETEARHAALVIDRLRTLFRKEHLAPVRVDVNTLIDDVVRLLRAAMLIGRIDIRLVSMEAVPAVRGDPRAARAGAAERVDECQ